MRLNRDGPSYVQLNTCGVTSEIDPRGFYKIEKECTVTITMAGLIDLELIGFSIQNVICGLTIEPVEEHFELSDGAILESADGHFKLTFEPCYGLSGYLLAKGISVEFTPLEPVI